MRVTQRLDWLPACCFCCCSTECSALTSNAVKPKSAQNCIPLTWNMLAAVCCHQNHALAIPKVVNLRISYWKAERGEYCLRAGIWWSCRWMGWRPYTGGGKHTEGGPWPCVHHQILFWHSHPLHHWTFALHQWSFAVQQWSLRWTKASYLVNTLLHQSAAAFIFAPLAGYFGAVWGWDTLVIAVHCQGCSSLGRSTGGGCKNCSSLSSDHQPPPMCCAGTFCNTAFAPETPVFAESTSCK